MFLPFFVFLTKLIQYCEKRVCRISHRCFREEGTGEKSVLDLVRYNGPGCGLGTSQQIVGIIMEMRG
jgi:hypothetical protein